MKWTNNNKRRSDKKKNSNYLCLHFKGFYSAIINIIFDRTTMLLSFVERSRRWRCTANRIDSMISQLAFARSRRCRRRRWWWQWGRWSRCAAAAGRIRSAWSRRVVRVACVALHTSAVCVALATTVIIVGEVADVVERVGCFVGTGAFGHCVNHR